MGLLYVDTLSPQSGTNITVGESGQNTVLPGNDIRSNVLQDAGGNAIFTSNGSGTLSGVSAGFGSAMSLLNTTTFSTDTAGVTFGSSLITSTYKHYIVRFYNVTTGTDNTSLVGQFSIDNGSNWNISTNMTFYQAQHNEADNNSSLTYDAGYDGDGQSTTWLYFSRGIGNAAREAGAGELHLIDPANTSLAKQWWNRTIVQHGSGDYAFDGIAAGYANTTTAINALHFKAASGYLSNGTFKLWGLK